MKEYIENSLIYTTLRNKEKSKDNNKEEKKITKNAKKYATYAYVGKK